MREIEKETREKKQISVEPKKKKADSVNHGRHKSVFSFFYLSAAVRFVKLFFFLH